MRYPYKRSYADGLFASMLFLVSLALAAITWDRVTWWTGDSFQYLKLGENLLAGRGHVGLEGTVNFYFPPVYPISLAALGQLLQSPIAGGRVISALGSALSVSALFLIGRRWYSTPVLLVGSLLYLALPIRIWSSNWVMSEGLYCGLVWGAILAAAVSGSIGGLVAGLLIGLGCLTRPEGILYLPAVLAILSFKDDRGHRWERGRLARIVLGSGCEGLTSPPLNVPSGTFKPLRRGDGIGGGPALAIATFTMATMPYLAYVHASTGSWIPTGRLEFSLAWAYAQDRGTSLGALVDFDEGSLAATIPEYSISAQDVAARYARNSAIELRRVSYLIGPNWLPLAILLAGIVVARGKPPRTATLVEQGLLLFPLLVLPFLFIADRLMLATLPLLCLWLGWGIVELATWVHIKSGSLETPALPAGGFAAFWNHRGRVLLAVALAIPFLLAYGWRVAIVTPEDPRPSMQVGRQLQDDATVLGLRQGRVMVSDPAIAYYAGQDWIAPPHAGLVPSLRYAGVHNATHLVARCDEGYWPATRELCDGSGEALPELIALPIPPSSPYLAFRIVGNGDRQQR